MNVGNLNISVKVDGKEAKLNLNQFAKATTEASKKISRSLDSQVVKWGAVSLAINNVMDLWRRGIQIFGSFITESNNNETALAQVKAVLMATGHAAGLTAEQVKGLTNRFEDMTGVAGSLIMQSEAILLTFKNIRGEAFERTMRIALSLKELFGDLKSSTVQLGKALNDPAQGLTALTRVGISFTEQEKSLIKNMMKVNDITGAQEVMFKALEGQADKVAEAVGSTSAGAMRKFQADINDLKSDIGDFMKEDLIPIINKLRILIKTLREHPAVIKNIYNVVKMLAGALLLIKITKSMQSLIVFFRTTLPLAIKVATAALTSFGVAIGVVVVGLGSIIYYYNKMLEAQDEATSREQQNAERLKKIYADAADARVKLEGKSIKEIASMENGLDLLRKEWLGFKLEYDSLEDKALKERNRVKQQQIKAEIIAIEALQKTKEEDAKRDHKNNEIYINDIKGKMRLAKEYSVNLELIGNKTTFFADKNVAAWNRIGKSIQGNFGDMQATLQSFVSQAKSLIDSFSNKIARTLTDSLFGVKVSWKDILKSMLYDFVNTMARILIKAFTTFLIMQALNAATGGMMFAAGATSGQALNALFLPSSSFNPGGTVMGGNIGGTFSEGSGGSVQTPGVNNQNTTIQYNIYNPLTRNNWETLDLVRQNMAKPNKES